MIGTDEMSSTGMDISESFRPEDISKTDFFDFVTAPDMGIGLGVNVNLHHSHHNHHQQQPPHQQQQQQQQHHQHHHPQHHTQQQQSQPPLTMTQQQQQQHLHNNNTHTHHGSQHQHNSSTDRTMTHDGGGGGGSGNGVGNGTSRGDSHNDASGLSDGSSASTTDPTLHGYEFWTSDKEHTSTIFEDLDRYCWQQQSNTTASTNNSSATVMHHSSPANTLNPLHTNTVNPASPHNHHSPATPVTTPTSLTSTPVPQTQLNSDGTISNIISTDGQIYTLTVLNGNEPWLKRDTDNQLNSTLDLDSLLGTFPGYIKSEYPYDDSGFSTDGCKDVNSDSTNVMTNNSSSGAGGIVNNQRLPSLINTISVTSSGGGGGGNGNVSNASDSVSTALSIGQQLDQFHNNNNDWHMTDHNNEQNSAESLLRSALQGKGYAKGLHMHNGITLMSTSPTVKDDEMRRILFPVDTDGLNFSDTSLSAAQIFDDTQTANGHNPHMVVPHSPVTNGPLTPVTNNPNTNNNNNNSSNQATSLIVDDMFLTLENAFSDDFEKIKQFCTAGSNTNDYTANDVMMQISPNGNGTTQATSPNTGSIQAVTTTHQPMLTSLHTSAISTTSTPNNICRQPTPVGGMATSLPTQQQQPPPQPLKPEVTTSTQRIVSTTKVTKKYKRTLAPAHHNSNNNNNNNPNVINHNNNNSNSNPTNTNKGSSNNMTLTNGQNRNGNNSSSGSSTNSSNSPTHCNGLMGGNGVGVIGGNTPNNTSANTSSTTSSSSSSSSSTPGQRKERSLHYCSICSKGFKDKYSVNVHIRTHTGEKPFACTLCGKSFRQKAHLAKHYQTHMAQKNNGSLVKGSSSKHHRSSTAQNLNTSAIGAHNHPRSLSIANIPNTPSSMTGSSVGGLVSGILSSSGLPSLGVPVSAASAPTTPTTILPPANGLLANR